MHSLESREAGFSLIEMVFAVLILSMGIAAGFRALDQSALGLDGALPRLLAMHAAENRAAEMRLQGENIGRQVVSNGPYTWDISLEIVATDERFTAKTLALTSPDHPGATLVIYQPVTE